MLQMAILADDERMFYVETAEKLKGPDRRRFMALSVNQLGPGGKALAARELGWCPETILKGLRELESGVPVVDDYSACGRKSAEEHLPNLIADIRELVDSQCQTDPRFQTQRLYRRISAPEVRCQLIERKGYTDAQLPRLRWMENKLNELGYLFAKVAKSKPQKKYLRPMRSSTT
jgi:hypothetical protein